jgi:fatty-acyl-CoA synthase
MLAGDILGERARLTPARTALVYVPTSERLSYGELNARSIRSARHWRELGINKGDCVGILAHNCIEYIEAFFAAAKTGIILVPLNTRLTAHELEYIIRDAGLRALIYSSDFVETVERLRGNVTLDFWLDVRDSPFPETSNFEATVCDAGDIYCLLYTSGTTGKPKGVMIPHRQIVWNAYNTAISWQLSDNDISPIFTPLCHAGGLAVFLTPLFLLGGTIVLHRAFDTAEIWQTIERERCTVVMAVPTIYKLLMDSPSFATIDVSRIRWLISGGAPLPRYIINAYQRRGITFKQGYGLTEVGVNCFAMTPEESRTKVGSIGRPMLFTEARLVDPAMNDVQLGVVGELLLRGLHVSRGYWNNPEATAAALDADGWFHTGDLARQDPDGCFYIAGRLKDMFISGGVNVYPAEIEAELLLCPEVRDAAVIGVPHETWGEVGVAFIVTYCASLTSEYLDCFLAERLAKFKVPREYLFLKALPQTAYGKVLKSELREQYLASRAAQSASGGGKLT